MRKLFLGVAFFVAGTFSAMAQPEHKLSLGVGTFSHAYIRQFIDNFTEYDWAYPGDQDHGTYKFQEKYLYSLPMTASLHYECSVGNHVALGLDFSYDYMRMGHKTEIWTDAGTEPGYNGGTRTKWDITHEKGSIYRHIFNIMPEVTIYWFKKRHVALYSQLSAGIRFNVEKETILATGAATTSLQERHFTCHVSAVGAEFGGQAWRGYATYGYGAQGICQLGVKHIFQGIEKEEKKEEE